MAQERHEAADAVATRAFTGAGLERLGQFASRLTRPAIRLESTTADEASIGVGASKLGGAPDVPSGFAWPAWKGAPLAFLGQVRLEDVHPFDAEGLLPPTGVLAFFYDASQSAYGADPADKGAWAVVYTAAGTPLARATLPDGIPAAARYHACTLSARAEGTLTDQPATDAPDAALTSDETTRYEDLLAAFPTANDHQSFRNLLLGYPDTLQDDMRPECQLAANGIRADQPTTDPRAQALLAGANTWRLLLQLDSDDHAGMRWGSAGKLYFWLPADAFAKRAFDAAWVVLQSD